MTTPDQTVVLRGIQWETYERLLADQQESSGTRLHYDCGTLEIMAPSFKHEGLKETLVLLFQLLASEMDIDFIAAGSTTFRRQELHKGFEPDASFYVRDALRMRTRDEIDLSVDPPPELVIEIEITRASLNKLSIFGALGIPEVWRYRDDRLEILRLESGAYLQITDSLVLPGVTSSVLESFVRSSREMQSTAWIKSVRDWART